MTELSRVISSESNHKKENQPVSDIERLKMYPSRAPGDYCDYIPI
jgi:hypothetical protein